MYVHEQRAVFRTVLNTVIIYIFQGEPDNTTPVFDEVY